MRTLLGIIPPDSPAINHDGLGDVFLQRASPSIDIEYWDDLTIRIEGRGYLRDRMFITLLGSVNSAFDGQVELYTHEVSALRDLPIVFRVNTARALRAGFAFMRVKLTTQLGLWDTRVLFTSGKRGV